MAYAVLDAQGNLVEETNDLDEAIVAAGSDIYLGDVDDGENASLAGLGAVDPSSMPRAAFRATGLPQLALAEVMSISTEEAHRELLPLFPRKRPTLGAPIRIYDTPRGMADSFLGQNYKTKKQDASQEPSDVQGLSLLPYWQAREPARRKLLPAAFRSRQVPKSMNLCVGASAACRAACLVYSGQNEIDQYNIATKIARTEALLTHPHHFARLLVEGIRRHEVRTAKTEYALFIRLNVFSDVPWELVFPDLFAQFPSIQFYDYTKVPGRDFNSQYDLTFSYSGVNHDFVDHELSRGRRVAVVFLPKGKHIPAKVRRPGEGLPQTFLGLPVVDGDVSDVRPRDPAPSIVGLRWKVPMGKGVGRSPKTKFVIPVEEADGWTIASQSAAQEPITDPDDQ